MRLWPRGEVSRSSCNAGLCHVCAPWGRGGSTAANKAVCPARGEGEEESGTVTPVCGGWGKMNTGPLGQERVNIGPLGEERVNMGALGQERVPGDP